MALRLVTFERPRIAFNSAIVPVMMSNDRVSIPLAFESVHEIGSDLKL
jgi:hypothetical protein